MTQCHLPFLRCLPNLCMPCPAIVGPWSSIPMQPLGLMCSLTHWHMMEPTHGFTKLVFHIAACYIHTHAHMKGQLKHMCTRSLPIYTSTCNRHMSLHSQMHACSLHKSMNCTFPSTLMVFLLHWIPAGVQVERL